MVDWDWDKKEEEENYSGPGSERGQVPCHMLLCAFAQWPLLT